MSQCERHQAKAEQRCCPGLRHDRERRAGCTREAEEDQRARIPIHVDDADRLRDQLDGGKRRAARRKKIGGAEREVELIERCGPSVGHWQRARRPASADLALPRSGARIGQRGTVQEGAERRAVGVDRSTLVVAACDQRDRLANVVGELVRLDAERYRACRDRERYREEQGGDRAQHGRLPGTPSQAHWRPACIQPSRTILRNPPQINLTIRQKSRMLAPTPRPRR